MARKLRCSLHAKTLLVVVIGHFMSFSFVIVFDHKCTWPEFFQILSTALICLYAVLPQFIEFYNVFKVQTKKLTSGRID